MSIFEKLNAVESRYELLMAEMADVGLTAICTDDPRVVPEGLAAPPHPV